MNFIEAVQTYDLPDIPDSTDENDETADSVDLILFRRDSDNVHLAYVTRADAKKYASRDDTAGDGYFVGFMEIY